MDNSDEYVSLNVFNQFALATNNKLDAHTAKLSEHDADIRFLKEMGASSQGNGDAGPGILDAIKEMIK